MVYGINDEGYPMDGMQAADTMADFLSDSGMNAPILMDQAFDPSCWIIPGEDTTVSEHFRNRVGDPNVDPPFPLHVLIHPDGTFAYLNRDHAPNKVLERIQEIVSATAPSE